MASPAQTRDELAQNRTIRLGYGSLTTEESPVAKIVLPGLGNHRVVAEHPARYANPQVVHDALRAVEAQLEIENNPQRLWELKKLEGNCLKCLRTKWQHGQ